MSNSRKIYQQHYHLLFDESIQIHHVNRNKENNSIRNLIALPAELLDTYNHYFRTFIKYFKSPGCFETHFFNIISYPYTEYNYFFDELQELRNEISLWVMVKKAMDAVIGIVEDYNIELWNNIELKSCGIKFIPKIFFTEKSTGEEAYRHLKMMLSELWKDEKEEQKEYNPRGLRCRLII